MKIDILNVQRVNRVVEIFRKVAVVGSFLKIEHLAEEGDRVGFVLVANMDEFDLTIHPDGQVVRSDTTPLFSLRSDSDEQCVLDLKLALDQAASQLLRVNLAYSNIIDRLGDQLLCLSILDADNNEGTITFSVGALAYELLRSGREEIIRHVRDIKMLAYEWCRTRGYTLAKVEQAN